MSKKSRDKGKRGERLVIDWLQPIVEEIFRQFGYLPPTLQRNTIQSDKGGTDIVGLVWLAAEVKNCEKDNPSALDDWWSQCEAQAKEWSTHKQRLTPVLFYTRAFRPIRVRMRSYACDPQDPTAAYTPCLADLSAEDFEVYFRARLANELAGTKA